MRLDDEGEALVLMAATVRLARVRSKDDNVRRLLDTACTHITLLLDRYATRIGCGSQPLESAVSRMQRLKAIRLDG